MTAIFKICAMASPGPLVSLTKVTYAWRLTLMSINLLLPLHDTSALILYLLCKWADKRANFHFYGTLNKPPTLPSVWPGISFHTLQPWKTHGGGGVNTENGILWSNFTNNLIKVRRDKENQFGYVNVLGLYTILYIANKCLDRKSLR